MPHNDYASPNGQWPDELALEPSRLRALDQNVSEGIDGDAGGTWAPDKPIIIGGSGLNMSGAFECGALSTGELAAAGPIEIEEAIGVTYSRSRVCPAHDDSVYQEDWDSVGYVEELGYAQRPMTAFPIAMPLGTNRTKGLHFNVRIHFSVAARPSMLPSAMPGIVLVKRKIFGSYGAEQSAYTIPTRASSTVYAVGDLVVPSTQNGRKFRCATAGTSAASQPASFATASSGDAVTDGTVSWTCEPGPGVGDAFHAITLPWPSSVDDYYQNGRPQSFGADLLLAAGLQLDTLWAYLTDASGVANKFHAVEMQLSWDEL